ncbi:MAG: hypothetical protein ACJ72K_03270 [Friedmanniella sp.]
MSTIGYADPQAPAPSLGTVGVPERADERARLVSRVRVAAGVPAVISLGAHWLFLVAYWIPETSAFPAHEWWLGQLSPLVAEAVTSAGNAQVAAQTGQIGLGGELLLVASLALLLLVRHPGLLGHGAALIPAAAGTLVATVEVLALLVGGRPSRSGVAIVLLAVWVWAAVYAALESLLVDVEVRIGRRWRDGLPWLAAYVVIAPAPTAVGRALFGPELRDAAESLRNNTVALRLAGLTSGANVLLYLSGVLLGIAVWAVYQCWPPRRDGATAARVLVAVVALLGTAAVGGVATAEARQRAEQIRYASPAADGHFGCGAAELSRAGDSATEPVRTLAITGLTCKNLTTFEGYRQLTSQTLPFSLAPVTAHGVDGRRLTGRVISAQYGDALVLAGTSRLDTGADRLLAVRVSDGARLWSFSCSDRRSLRLRFAGVPAGDDPARGHLTAPGETAEVVTVCGERTQHFDPASGRLLPEPAGG